MAQVSLKETQSRFENALQEAERAQWVPVQPARPEKLEGGRALKVVSEMSPAGDQPQAIEELTEGVIGGERDQVLLGVTGSGKTFTMAHVIQNVQKPTLILAHNKTLAAQLYGELKEFFPDNAVEYFVSHYDYYQPEAYLPKRDLYIEKELSMNERIEQERFSTVASLVSRPDVLVVATVSAIYGLNPPETFLQQHVRLHVGQQVEPQDVVKEFKRLIIL